jgi:hypothetical protein
MSLIKATRLYIKRHKVTGLKYFGKSTSNLIESYNGSGKYWKTHIAKHGKQRIEHVWNSQWFYNKKELEEFALAFSELFDIVKSNEWANLIVENGLDGGDISNYRKYVPLTEEHKNKLRKPRLAARKPKSEQTKAKMKIAQLNRPAEVKAKISASNKGKPKSKQHIDKVVYTKSMAWIIIQPNGEQLEIINLSKFCRENKLSSGSLRGVALGNRKQHKGYTCIGPINKEILFKG